MPTTELTHLSKTESFIFNHLFLKITLVQIHFILGPWIYGVHHQQINALEISSGVAQDPHQQVEMFSTQFKVQDLEVSTRFRSNTEELKSKLNFQKVIGFGQQSGFYQKITIMVNGQHLVKLILWNQEVTLVTAQLEEALLLDQHFIGVQTTNSICMKRQQLNINTLLLLVMTSIFMDSNGQRLE